jgi:hypothetical protein
MLELCRKIQFKDFYGKFGNVCCSLACSIYETVQSAFAVNDLAVLQDCCYRGFTTRQILMILPTNGAPLTFVNRSELPTDQSKSKKIACFHGNKRLDQSEHWILTF